MFRTVAQWTLSSIALLLAVTGLTFVFASLAPGSAITAVLGNDTAATPEQYEQVKHQLGLDRPLPAQYWHWLSGLLRGDLGNGLFDGQPITDALNARLGPSLSIILATLVVSGVLGIGVGVYSAVRGGVIGRLLDVVAITSFAIPNFWLAVVLIEVFAVQAGLFPATGYAPLATDPVRWAQSIALPVITLSAAATSFLARQTRDSMLRVLAKDFIVSLRAQGLSNTSIIFKHALRNAAIPVVTALGLMFIGLLGGTVFIENVFAIPGLGQVAVIAGVAHDLPKIEGIALYFAVFVIAVNLVVDVSYRVLNPRARAAR
ncbi:ABC transporter permease [Dactylosporangium sp. CA-092794]|uniref:ABC transporter permease n=1 Tax=Dactylosporangium sp. CA-092794 TaxID=3239929 RepID=UPI003D91D183